MGFMDKAKQLAEQAQQKLEETQKQFNDSQAQKAAATAQASDVRYDEHGRPISEPASAPQVADPAPEAPDPAAEARSKPSRGSDGVDSNPDPFKPIQ